MRIHFLQHVPFEGIGFIGDWAQEHHHSLSGTALFSDEPFPELSTFDFLVVLGGPMGVHDASQYPWLTNEKQFIERSLRMEKQVIGICLGAQLIADVLGARVVKNKYKEIGWHPVKRSEGADPSPVKDIFPEQFFAFHWHGDTFDLPTGAVHLAESEACHHQAFFHAPATLGLQFHLESSKNSIKLLIDHCGHELVRAPFVQSAEDIRKKSGLIAPSNDCMRKILEFFEGYPFSNNHSKKGGSSCPFPR